MTDPRSAQARAEAAGERAAEQLRHAKEQEPRVQRLSLVSRWFLDANHLGELLEQALGVRK